MSEKRPWVSAAILSTWPQKDDNTTVGAFAYYSGLRSSSLDDAAIAKIEVYCEKCVLLFSSEYQLLSLLNWITSLGLNKVKFRWLCHPQSASIFSFSFSFLASSSLLSSPSKSSSSSDRAAQSLPLYQQQQRERESSVDSSWKDQTFHLVLSLYSSIRS